MHIYSNRRYQKAQHVTAHLMHILRNVLPATADFRAITKEVEEFFYATGIDFYTEADRIQAGLRPRDHLGYTIEELKVMDARFMEAMLKPMMPIKNEE